MALESVLHILKDGQEVLNQRIEGEISVGRSAACGIRLDDRAISRNHLQLVVTGEGVQLERRSDFSPVRVNGQETERALLKNGDQVGVGPYLMRLEIFEARTRQTHNGPEAALSLPSASEIAPIELSPAASASVSSGGSAGGGEFLPFETDQGRDAAGEFSMGLSADAPAKEESSPEAEQPASDSEPVSNDAPSPMAPIGGSDFSEDASPIADDGRTRVASMEKIDAKLVFAPGSANFETYVLREPEISVGRGKICTIVLNDKKASRKHAVIRRIGASFVIKDLQSANGTFVNGIKIEEQELSSEDRVVIGDVEFTFQASAADYQAESIPSAESILPNDDEIPSLDGVAANGMSGLEGFGAPDPAAQGAAPVNADPLQLNLQQATPGGILNQINNNGAKKKQSMYEKYIRNFKDLNPRQKMMTVFVVASLTYFIFIEDEDKEIPQGRTPSAVKSGKPQSADQKKAMRDFSALPEDKQRFVDSQYNLSFDHFQNREFDKALYEVQKIFTYVDDYKDAKRIEQAAKDGKRTLEKLEEEKRRKEKQEEVRLRVADLTAQAEELMKTKSYVQVREVFGEILALDPENTQVAEWQKIIQAIEEEKAIAAQREEIEKATSARAWETYNLGKGFQKKGQCHSAIAKFDEVIAADPTDQKLNRLTKGARRACLSWIRSRVAPHLESAKTAEAEQNFIAAFQSYRKVVKIDPPNKLGAQGIARVRDRLHEYAKVLYTEGVIAEDYSDLVTARAKFTKIIESVPEDDRYYQSAERKLGRYKALTQTLDQVESRMPASESGDASESVEEVSPAEETP